MVIKIAIYGFRSRFLVTELYSITILMVNPRTIIISYFNPTVIQPIMNDPLYFFFLLLLLFLWI